MNLWSFIRIAAVLTTCGLAACQHAMTIARTRGSLYVLGEFSGQKVLIYVDDALIYSRKTKTEMSTGVAACLPFVSDAGKATLRVVVPSLRLRSEFHFERASGSYTFVDLKGRQLEWRQSKSAPLFD